MAPGAMQIIVVILLVMLFFGAGRIPTIMENLAKGVNSFKKGLKDEPKAEKTDDATAAVDTPPKAITHDESATVSDVVKQSQNGK